MPVESGAGSTIPEYNTGSRALASSQPLSPEDPRWGMEGSGGGHGSAACMDTGSIIARGSGRRRGRGREVSLCLLALRACLVQ